MSGQLTVTDLTTLDPVVVRQNLALLVDLVRKLVPGADARRGVMRDIVLHFSAILGTAEQSIVDTVLASADLLSVAADPGAADAEVVDRLLSNYRVTRRAGASATGVVQVVLSSPAVVTVPRGVTFTAGSRAYAPTAAFTSRASASAVLSATDRPLAALGDGTYGFSVDVADVTTGAAGNLSRGTRLTPSAPLAAQFVRAAAATDFAGGADAETTASLLGRLASGVGARAWSNRMTVDALLRGEPALALVLGTSAIGYGDPEMTRDQHGVWPGSYGGRVDLYVRTQAASATALLSKTATLVSVSGAGAGVWQFSLGRDEVPGFYAVTGVSQAGRGATTAGYEITADVRGYDLTGLVAPLPDVASAEEAAYTRYATTTVRFVDTDTVATGLTVGSAARGYDVAVSYLPLIAEAQDFLRGRDVAAPAGDVLVRAPIPVTVAASLAVGLRASAAAPPVAVLRRAAADAVNGLGFGSVPTAAEVSAAVLPLLPAGSKVTGVTLSGSLRHCDGTVVSLPAADSLPVPADATRPATSPRTVGYFLDPSAVSVTFTTIDNP